ncbi:MAG: chemotaxis protein CheR [Bryobacteraceae bacterium]|nr:chemotaxis protein CheR [Bryobacteraceae bacterium]
MSEILALPDISRKEFLVLRDYLHQSFGLELRDGKERLVIARLSKFVKAGNFVSFEQYIRHVQTDPTGDRLTDLIDAMTTNHTSFMREPEHFRFFLGTVLPELGRRSSVSVWSAACSTGEEPYSLLFSVADAQQSSAISDVRITATDISTRVLRNAKEAIFTMEKVRALPPGWLQKFFQAPDKIAATAQVKAEWRSKIEFQRYNLMHALPFRKLFSAIFCRNVMIYFDKPTQSSVVKRLSAALEPGGYLMVGHSESLTGLDHSLQYVKPAIYRKAL